MPSSVVPGSSFVLRLPSMTDGLSILVWAIAGLLAGNAINVLAWRLPRDRSPLTLPLRCRACGARLGVPDLLPLASVLLWRGRCRHNGERVPLESFAIELATAIVFSLIGIRFGSSAFSALLGLYAAVLILVFVIDWNHHLILNEVTFPLMAVGILAAAWFGRPPLFSSILGGAAAGLVLTVIYLTAVYRYPDDIAFGLGDVKLGIAIGLMVGLPGTIMVLFSGSVIAAVGGLVLCWVTRRSLRDTFIPWGSALAAAAVLAIIWNRDLWDWYRGAS
ncbi:MAG: prepilin peptidase [Chloroflexi bacterium]|nr:prepilin peptidase [Chloroflexota bacterium]